MSYAALEEWTELGIGYIIALHDLLIRNSNTWLCFLPRLQASYC